MTLIPEINDWEPRCGLRYSDSGHGRKGIDDRVS